MIDMKLEGYGYHRITKYLNENNISSFSGKSWRTEVVNKYLKMIQLKGDSNKIGNIRTNNQYRPILLMFYYVFY